MKKNHIIVILLLLSLILPIKVDAANLRKTYEECKVMEDGYDGFPILSASFDNNNKFIGHTFHLNSLVSNVFNFNEETIFMYNPENKIYFESKNKNFNLPYKYDVKRAFFSENSNVKGKSDLFITITDSNNNIVSEKLYGGSGNEVWTYLMPAFDASGKMDGLLVYYGTTSLDINGVKPGCVKMKIDFNGNIIWQRNTTDTYCDNLLYDLYGLIPVYYNDGAGHDYFYSIDGQGLKKYEFLDGKKETANLVAKKDTDMSGYLVPSYNTQGNQDGFVMYGPSDSEGKMLLIKYDFDLKEKFRSISDGVFNNGLNNIIASKDINGKYDGYIVVTVNEKGNGLIEKFNLNGKKIWSDESYLDAYDVYLEITESYDSYNRFNGYAIAGVAVNTEDEESLVFTKYTYDQPIEKETSDEGTITVDDKAYPGDTVKVKVSPKNGYSLKRIVVMTDDGKEIEVTDDGTFTMPESKVTVLALYNKIINPDTTSACYIVLGIVLLISIGTLIVNRKNRESE